jgi:hypothetical protein
MRFEEDVPPQVRLSNTENRDSKLLLGHCKGIRDPKVGSSTKRLMETVFRCSTNSLGPRKVLAPAGTRVVKITAHIVGLSPN